MIIGRRDPNQIEIESARSPAYRLDLSRSNLRKAVLENGNFANAVFSEARMEGAYCVGVDFSGAKLNYAHLIKANASGTNFNFTQLGLTNFAFAILDNATFHNSNGAGTLFHSTQLLGARFTREEPLESSAQDRMNFENCSCDNALFDTLKPVNAFSFSNEYSNGKPDFQRFKRAAFKNTDIPSDWLARGIDPMIIFADASVTLPSNYTRPKNWPTKTLSAPDFQTEWHKWQANPKTYTPP